MAIDTSSLPNIGRQNPNQAKSHSHHLLNTLYFQHNSMDVTVNSYREKFPQKPWPIKLLYKLYRVLLI
jgi:hypothetical protein